MQEAFYSNSKGQSPGRGGGGEGGSCGPVQCHPPIAPRLFPWLPVSDVELCSSTGELGSVFRAHRGGDQGQAVRVALGFGEPQLHLAGAVTEQ